MHSVVIRIGLRRIAGADERVALAEPLVFESIRVVDQDDAVLHNQADEQNQPMNEDTFSGVQTLGQP